MGCLESYGSGRVGSEGLKICITDRAGSPRSDPDWYGIPKTDPIREKPWEKIALEIRPAGVRVWYIACYTRPAGRVMTRESQGF